MIFSKKELTLHQTVKPLLRQSYIMKKLTGILCLLLILASCSRHNTGRESCGVESPIVADDLSNKMVNSIVEDAQGHIWMGTFRGLNKYDVHEYHQYFCTDDSLGLPDNQIKYMMRDSRGRLWIATVNGTCMYTDKDNFKHFPINCDNKNTRELLESRSGAIFMSTMHQLLKFNPDTEEFDLILQRFDPQHTFQTRCFIDPGDKLWAATPFCLRRYDTSNVELEDSIPLQGYPSYFFMEKSGMIWMDGAGGMQLYDTQKRRFIPVPAAVAGHPLLSRSHVNLIHPYGNDCLLFNTDMHGLFVYNRSNGSVLHQNDNGFPFEAPEFKISTMFTDSRNNLWIGSEDQGYTVRYHYKKRFNTNSFLASQFRNISVNSVDADNDGNLWISTKFNGLFIYNSRDNDIKRILPQELFGNEFRNKSGVNNLLVVDNEIWLASYIAQKVLKCSYYNGIFKVEKSYDVFMPMSITADSNGTIWVGTAASSILALRQGYDTFQPVSVFLNCATFIPGLIRLNNGKILAAAFMNPLRYIDEGDWSVSEPSFGGKKLNNAITRSVFIPTGIRQDSRGDLWIGTVSNGLLKYSFDTDTIEHIGGTPCLDISSIEEDRQGNIWVSTQYGLGKYDRTTGEFTNYFAPDGIGGNQFFDRSSCSLADGTLVFGGTHGLTIFNPMDVSVKRTIPVLFEDLKIHNALVRPQDSHTIDKHLSYCPEINLDYDENGFSISFAALDYSEHERVHYYYMMEGFDKYWIDAHNNREVYYANLPAGTYTFRVKVTNNDHSIVETENAIKVIIRPAPWLSWWAWCIYIVLAVLIIAFIARMGNRIKKEKEEARRSRIEKEQEQRMNKMNMSFFANVSHEFRTPLTMIAGPVAQLCESPGISKENRQMLLIVQRSISRMFRLVNQLMDFNKLENDTLKLRVRRTDIISTLNQYLDIYRMNAAEKGITLNIYGLEDSFLMMLDVDKLEKIIANLLSNALKFTAKGGHIDVSLDVVTATEARATAELPDAPADAQYVKITVADTGAGIPPKQLEKIFLRYYQLDNNMQGTYSWGTGIGLYYARSLARLHHGQLVASNRTEGTGAVFTLLLPVSDNAYATEERSSLDEERPLPYRITSGNAETHEENTEPADKPTILVVDDDSEVVHYLRTLLSPHYNVICRFDAESAFKAVGEENPDLILSDVAMPGITGYDLCRRLKDDMQLCHIPVVLVTAMATVENQVEGLDTGADAYVTKPFEPTYLLALIKSQLSNREKVRSLLNRSTHTDTISADVLSSQDKAFMTELYQLMENELSNPELDVARMTKLMRISRTKFYYKVKGLTGQNPGVFFRTYKLNRAAEFIREGKYTVSEIADMTGFSTLSYFSTAFKKHFGTSPSDYNA